MRTYAGIWGAHEPCHGQQTLVFYCVLSFCYKRVSSLIRENIPETSRVVRPIWQRLPDDACGAFVMQRIALLSAAAAAFSLCSAERLSSPANAKADAGGPTQAHMGGQATLSSHPPVAGARLKSVQVRVRI